MKKIYKNLLQTAIVLLCVVQAFAIPIQVPDGGTGQKYFATGTVLVGNGIYGIATVTVSSFASSSPTLGYLTATNTSATSTFSGGVYITKLLNAISAIFGTLTVTGNVNLGTTTANYINGVIYVNGTNYPRTIAGINSALSDCYNKTGCYKVYLDEGIYSMGSNSIFLQNNIALQGSGVGKTIIQKQSTDTSTDFVLMGGSYYVQNVTVSDITFDANLYRSTGGQIFQFKNLTIENTELKNINATSSSAWGWRLGQVVDADIASSTSENLVFKNNYIHNNYGNTFEQMLLPNVNNADISNNIFRANSAISGALYDEVSVYVYCNNVRIHDNLFDNSNYNAFGAKQGDNFFAYNNTVLRDQASTTATAGARLRNYNNAMIFDNTFQFASTSNTSSGIIMSNNNTGLDGHPLHNATATAYTLKNNKFFNVYYGIYSFSSSASLSYLYNGIIIDGNEFYTVFKSPIRLGTDDSSQSYDNIFIRNNVIDSFIGNIEAGIWVQGASTSPASTTGIYIENNHIGSNTVGANSGGIRIVGAQVNRIVGNHFGTYGSYGQIGFANNGTANTIYGNYTGTTTAWQVQNTTGSVLAKFESGCLFMGTIGNCVASTTGNITAYGGANGIGYWALNGATHIFSFLRQGFPSNASLAISAFGGISLNAGTTTPSAGGTQFVLTTAGNIGVGTSTPQTRFTIQESSGTSTLSLVTNSTNGENSLQLMDSNYSKTATSSWEIIKQNTADTVNAFGLTFGHWVADGTFMRIFQITANGHIITGALTPSFTSCGTSPSLATSSDDTAGTLTVGTLAGTTCTLNFAKAFNQTPHCIVKQRTEDINPLVYTVSSTSIVLTRTSISSSVYDYICVE